MKANSKDRRNFLLKTSKAMGYCAVGGVLLSGYIHENKSHALMLRPPGAYPEDVFLRKCIRCGLCVQACPYDTLVLANPGDDAPLGTPFFKPRKIPCYMCEDIPCAQACPSGALGSPLLSSTGSLDINTARMGVAMIDSSSCIAFWGLRCDACYRVCPLMDKAISVDFQHNERTGEHARIIPRINPEFCTGCGLCEHACVTMNPSIFILPRKVGTGERNPQYLRGWDTADTALTQQTSHETITVESDAGKSIDYLNSDDLLDE